MMAEICGKMFLNGEDQLTGDVFGALRYVDEHCGLIPILKSSYFLGANWETNYLKFSYPKIESIRFWPWTGEAEPDLLVEMTEKGSDEKPDMLTVISIEIKYNSGLSAKDQLIRQMRGMKDKYPDYRRIQIYLTAEIAYPVEILSKNKIEADRLGLGAEIYWLSWHDLPSILNQNKNHLSANEKLVISDIISLLDRKGFGRFSKVDIPSGWKSLNFVNFYLLDAPKPSCLPAIKT